MAIRAKFWVTSVVLSGGNETVSMSAVYANSPENKLWSEATPTASLQMNISNPAAQGQFKQGQEVYVDFTPINPADPDDGDVTLLLPHE